MVVEEISSLNQGRELEVMENDDKESLKVEGWKNVERL